MKVTVHYDETKQKVLETDYVPLVGDRLIVSDDSHLGVVESRGFVVKGKKIEAHVYLR